ncbi:MAG: D-aminoacyl-tRNA deacylase [Polyangiales bacterium]
MQRVASARVDVDGAMVGAIDRGLLVYLGVAENDGATELEWLADKIAGLRIFPDSEGKMSKDVMEVGGKVLVVSQFTLLGDVRKGRRPSFVGAMAPGPAERVYEAFTGSLRARGVPVETGKFRADMKVSSLNDGPITLVIDSSREGDARHPGAATPLPTRGQ